jgi:ABC-type glycerol-3-phosphate transport system substrate-binding protein
VQPDVAPQPLILPDVICVNTVISPEQRSAALDFIRYLIAQPAQETLWSRGQLLPVHRAAKLAAEAQPFREIALGSQPLRSEVAATAVWRPLNDVLRSVLFNTATPAEALDSASAALQKQQP